MFAKITSIVPLVYEMGEKVGKGVVQSKWLHSSMDRMRVCPAPEGSEASITAVISLIVINRIVLHFVDSKLSFWDSLMDKLLRFRLQGRFVYIIFTHSLSYLINFSIISVLDGLSCLGKDVAFCIKIKYITGFILDLFNVDYNIRKPLAVFIMPLLPILTCFLRYRSLSSLVSILICCPLFPYRHLELWYLCLTTKPTITFRYFCHLLVSFLSEVLPLIGLSLKSFFEGLIFPFPPSIPPTEQHPFLPLSIFLL